MYRLHEDLLLLESATHSKGISMTFTRLSSRPTMHKQKLRQRRKERAPQRFTRVVAESRALFAQSDVTHCDADSACPNALKPSPADFLRGAGHVKMPPRYCLHV
jgi:hypothetical protein